MKAILWDNDGVLVDTEHLYFAATRDELRAHGVTLDEDTFAEMSLQRGGSCFDLLAQRGVSPADVEAARGRRNRRYAELLENTELIPGVLETLAALYGRMPLAVVTSSRPEHFELQHARTGARRFFEFVLTGADKPDPQPYLLAANRLGVAPEECLAIEDSERGLTSAIRAGMYCAVIPRGLAKRGNFTAAHRVLEHVGQVPELVADLLASWGGREP